MVKRRMMPVLMKEVKKIAFMIMLVFKLSVGKPTLLMREMLTVLRMILTTEIKKVTLFAVARPTK